MNAVYYCRVSTDEEVQVDALKNQISEAVSSIEVNGWNLVDAYVDEGKSGTQTKTRTEYNRLYDDMLTNKFDIIVVKSQDRLMRNVKDWYIFLDRLVNNNKKLFFYLENKFYTPDDALITGIKAILAEEFSRDLSKKIKSRHETRQRTGSNVVLTSNTWGYDKVNKQTVINEKEAEIVRLIYDLYIQGNGSRTISKELSNRGIKSRSGNDFAEVTIRQIIRNPLYKGTAVMNKRKKDFSTKKTTINSKDEWIFHEDAVPPIVSKDIWGKANRAMDKRSKVVRSDEFGERVVGRNLGKYSLSSKIICGMCGSVYWRRYRKNAKGEQIVDWSCSEYIKRGRKKTNKDPRGKNLIKVEVEDGGCENIHIKEVDLNNILTSVSDDVFGVNRSTILDKVVMDLRTAMSSDAIQKEKELVDSEKNKIIHQKDLLLEKLLDGIITDEDYRRKDRDLETRLSEIKVKETGLEQVFKDTINIEERIASIKESLESKVGDISKKDRLIKHIEYIKVYPEYLEIKLDIFDPIRVGIKKKKKDFQYVKSTKYLASIDDKVT